MGKVTGRFLVFEGLDGSGKSTLMKRVAAELTQKGVGFVMTREPGGTELAEEIRHLLLKPEGDAPVATTELLLYAASRAQHVARVIRPALARGEWVICDRFTASTVAFQCFARGLSRANVDWLNDFATAGLGPDLTILLDLSVEESRRRRRNQERQPEDRMERESSEFHEKVRQGYLAQSRDCPASWLVLDAGASPEELAAKTHQAFTERRWLD
jgi:dTMP kinase